jgi:hypothetical protein
MPRGFQLAGSGVDRLPGGPGPELRFRGSGRLFEVDSADEATFGNVKADVLERYVPGYQRGNFVGIIVNFDWPQ